MNGRILALTLLSATVAVISEGAAAQEGTCDNPISLDGKATALRETFNEAKGDVRLLFVVDPICPTCLIWDPSGDFGRSLSRALDLKNKKGDTVFAWDVWLLYGPSAEWSAPDPPRPRRLMHQLMALSDGSDYEFLDTEAFAKSDREALGLPGSR